MTFFSKRKGALIFTLIIMAFGIISFFLIRGTSYERMGEKSEMGVSLELYKNINFKMATTPEGNLKLFALADPNVIGNLPTIEGESIPFQNKIVLGSAEAEMMIEEGLISGVGSNLTDFFGINVTIGGILDETESIVDDVHFLSDKEFEMLVGDSESIMLLFSEENTPKFFYLSDPEENLSWALSEGDWNSYKEHELLGKTYLPLVIGYKEAEMMISEGLFKNAGDRIDGFFGKDVIVVGILEPTNSALDMMHILPSSFETKEVSSQ